MRSREKVYLVLWFRLPRRPRKTKSPSPNFVTGLLHVSKIRQTSNDLVVAPFIISVCVQWHEKEKAYFFSDEKKVFFRDLSLICSEQLIHNILLDFLEIVPQSLFQNHSYF